MKNKGIGLILSFLIFISNTGLAFNVHYCGNEVSSISLKTNFSDNNNFEKDCCGVNEKKSHCCNDKIFHFQKNLANAIVKSFSHSFNSFGLIQEYKPSVFLTISILLIFP